MSTQNTDPFDSSHRKIARAKEHFDDLKRKIDEFTWSNPYERVIEPHPDKPDHEIHKFKLTKNLPPSIADITADLVQNLRNSLDNSAYAIAVAVGNSNPKNCAFPFARNVTEMANSLGRSKDLPQQIQSLFCGFQPYLGGNDLLWALNEICVADKHKIAIPIGTGIFRASADVKVTGWFSMPNPHVWDRTKNEMEIITTVTGSKFKYNFDFRLFVAFNNIKVVDGQPVLGVLYNLIGIIESILVAIEAESRRLGFVK